MTMAKQPDLDGCAVLMEENTLFVGNTTKVFGRYRTFMPAIYSQMVWGKVLCTLLATFS